MNKTWRLVDLPGYGYAHVAQTDKSQFNRAVMDYLEHRANLCLVFALIDAGLEPQAIDLEFVEWLVRREVPFVLVFTKTDKFPAATVEANIAAFTARIAPWFVQPPARFTCSAKTADGRPELLGVIDEQLAAIKAELRKASAPSGGSPNRKANSDSRKPRPDRARARPW